MPIKLSIIKKRKDFINVKLKGISTNSDNLILQKLANKKLNNSVIVGYTATKKLGSAVKRNKAKRLMRELVKNNLLKYGEKNFLYVLIAKKSIFDTSFENLNKEFKKLLSKK